ncbi:unnamed protein product [Caenorhabditis bovis]|uniref:Uncharacterized protein n=1 Tax=Caenorhabditis bovis TaxID=2654633 RepID=A0A8S1EQ14_9PELO|nr:unnamed protein product [Caenorhabditis bovis]
MGGGDGGPRVRIDVVDQQSDNRLQRAQSHGSDTATINFVTDDRMQEDHEEYNAYKEAYEEEERREYVIVNGEKRLVNQHYDSRGYSSSARGNRGHSEHQRRRNMAVDYSSNDFRQSLAAIDQASREGAISREGGDGGVRVRQIGDTTIMTEHRDPYSFYWQLDQARRESESPPRPRPPTDYVIDEEEVVDTVLSPESHDSGIVYENQYSRPHRVPLPPPPPPMLDEEPRDLPPGWEKHQDPQGYSYYWHVDSGTIQRQPPPPVREVTPPPPPARSPTPPVYSVTTSNREVQVDAPPPQIIQLPPQQPVIEEHAFKQTTTKRRIEQDEMSEEGPEELGDGYQKPVRFAVRSLGWTEIAEDELTAEKSSRAVNRAIVDLSTGRNDLMDNIAKWGDGRELIMELDDNELSLIDPDTMNVIHSERIQAIRVWGVGRDNGRDFAYVARDRSTRRFMCHVFRCDTPAKAIANALRDICKRIMLHRRPSSLNAIEMGEKRIVKTEGLSTPIDEPRKVIRCHFLGVTQVPKATGIEILNEAVDRLVSQVRPERWILADVSIAPSTINIVEVNGQQIAECRVRYLSFLGIGRDVKHCAFIMHTSSESFLCYVFHVEPSAAAMAKTIEAACKLRYQKVLDAHASRNHSSASSIHHGPPPPPASSSYHGKGWTDTFRDAFGSMTQRIAPSRSSHRI